MQNRTRVIAAAALTAALAAGSTAAALASTAGAKPGAPAKAATSASGQCNTDSDLAARLGVSVARLHQAMVAVKTSLSKGSGDVTQQQFDAAMAAALGIPQARVHQVFASAGPECGGKGGGKGGGKPADPAAERQAQAALIAAVAATLHVSTARVSAALAPMFAVGHADPASPTFAAAARSLGVSPQQLQDALAHAKESLAGGRGGRGAK